MFSFLKDKLKGALEKISKKVEEAPAEKEATPVEKTPAPKKEKKTKTPKKKIVEEKPSLPEAPEKEKTTPSGFFTKIFKKKDEPEAKDTSSTSAEQLKRGIFSKITEKITTTQISLDQFDELFTELEMAMLENNVALSVIDRIKDQLKKDLVDVPIKRGKVLDTLKTSLHDSIEDLFSVEQVNIVQRIKETKDKPFVIVFVGVNGSGKTTSIAKFAYLLKQQGLSSIMAAGDTWRAASIQQLEEHGKNLGIRVVKQDYGSDPAAIAFDAIAAAKAHKIDVVLVDTAGRQHSNKNLMEEMKKIIRVAKPNLKIFVAESITGNDAVEQGKQFNEAIGIDGIILTKSDVDEKGGAAISVTHVTGKPILYLGSGQGYKDMTPFAPDLLLERLGL